MNRRVVIYWTMGTNKAETILFCVVYNLINGGYNHDLDDGYKILYSIVT